MSIILSEHIKSNCDQRLIGTLSLGIREAYNYLEELIEKEPLLRRPEMIQSWGYLRHGLVDVGLRQVLESSNIPHKIADKTTSRYPNGHTYLMIEAKGAIITPSKVSSKIAVPRSALYRNKGSIMNREIDLFTTLEDLNSIYDSEHLPFMILTYGGSNQKLEFVKLGLPELGVNRWISQVDITNAPVLLPNTDAVTHELHLTFTAEAEELIRRSEENAREEGI